MKAGIRLRFIIQFAAFFYILFIGIRFIMYVTALQNGDMTATKPPGVEGFLPISALLGFKQLLLTGQYDHVHAAGLSIFLAIVITSIVFKKSFCSHICPVGFVSELSSKLGKNLHIPPYIPIWVIKYVLLGFFVYIVVTMSIQAVQGFILSPYNVVSDYKMLQLFFPPSRTTVIVVLALFLLTLLFRNFWCKYLCPYGALLGLLSVISPVKIKRDGSLCINCHKCRAACPASINVYKKQTVYNPDCIGCHECIEACPVKGCLNTSTVKYNKYFPLIIIGLYLLLILIAIIAGLWHSSVPNEYYLYFMKMQPAHP